MLLILYDVVWWAGINRGCCCCYCCSVAKSCWLFETPCTAACQASLSLIISWSWPRFMFIAPVMPSNHLILWCPLLLCPWSFPESGTFPMSCLFASGDQYWSFSFRISPSSEYSGLISLKIAWLDLLAVQRTFRGLLQHHNLKASILWRSAYFIV